MKALTTSIIFFVSVNVLAAKSPNVSQWSLHYLARASNVLLVANDAVLNNEKAPCGIKKSEAQKLSMNLKKIIDVKVKSLTQRQRKIVLDQAPNCKEDCTCDIYSLALENDSDSVAQKTSELINLEGSKMTSEQRKVCANHFQQFCSSLLLKALRH